MMELERMCRNYGWFTILGPYVTGTEHRLLDAWVDYCKAHPNVKFKDLVNDFTDLHQQEISHTWGGKLPENKDE